MADIKEFIAEVKNGALARSNVYLIDMSIPDVLRSSVLAANGKMKKLYLYCNSAQLPGLNISTTQSRTFGEVREMPYEKLYDNVSLSFYVDKDMYVKKFFDQWITNIQNPRTRTFSYYDEYISDFTINVYDVSDKQTYSVNLYEAYPKTLSPITLGYDQKDVMQVQVSLNYKYWSSQIVSTVNVTKRDENGQIQAVVDPFQAAMQEIQLPFSTENLFNPSQFINQQLVELQGLGDFVDGIGSLTNFFGG